MSRPKKNSSDLNAESAKHQDNKKLKFQIFPHHPNYDLSKRPPFLDCYRLVSEVVCPIEGHRPAAIVLDRTSPRICALCGGGEGEVTFEEEAHTLPASFGNRHHTTKEECDECNLLYGKAYEQHLALWLSPERTMHRIRRRPNEPPPSLAGPHGTVLEVDGITGALVFKLDPQLIDQIVTSERKEISIPYVRPACNKVSALRSIIKTAWLLLGQEERARHPLLLKLIRKELSLARWEYWDLTLPGNGAAEVRFEVWERKQAAETIIAPLMVRFTVGRTVLIWVEPDESTGEQAPSPFPTIKAIFELGEAPTIPANLFEIKKDETFPAKEEKIIFKYASLSKGDTKLPPRQPPRWPQTKTAIQLVHATASELTIDTICFARALDENNIRLYISGEDFCASIIIVSNSLEEKTTAKISFEFDGATTQAAFKTIQFLKSLRNNAGDMLLRTLDGKVLFTLTNIGKKDSIPLPMVEQVLLDIATINEEFGVNIRYKYSASEEDLDDLWILATAIRNNGVVAPPFLQKSMTINGQKKGALQLIERCEKEGPSEILFGYPVNYSLWGVSLPTIDRHTVLTEASLVDTADELRKKFESAADDEIVSVPMIGSMLMYRFPRWKIKED